MYRKPIQFGAMRLLFLGVIAAGALTGMARGGRPGPGAVTRPYGAPQPLPDARPDLPGPFVRLGRVAGRIPYRGAFSRDGSKFLTLDYDEAEVRVWDARTLRPLAPPIRHHRVVNAAFSADGKTVFTAGGSDACFWDAATSVMRQRIRAEAWLTSAVSPDFSLLAARETEEEAEARRKRDDDSVLGVWDVASGRRLRSLRHDAVPMFAAFSPDGAWLVTEDTFGPPLDSDGESRFRLWDVRTGRELMEPLRVDYATNAVADGHVTPAAFSPDRKRLVAATGRGFVVIGLPDGKKLAAVAEDADAAQDRPRTYSVGLSPDGRQVMLGTLMEGHLEVWDARTPQLTAAVPGNVWQWAMSPDGRSLLFSRGTADQAAELWRGDPRRRVQVFPPGRWNAVDFSPDGSRVALAHGDEKQSFSEVWELKAPE